ncbi:MULTISPECIES: ProQ/FINO family protein [unclassified Sinorhizobium]|uniref:ProQ/FINO family protein n=1 Tax=unclassified Sinorhizobium TaxID=2613772 RepID=UPI00352333EA
MDRPWTVSRGPIAATELDVLKAQAINTLLVRPIGILPVKAGDPIRPFAIGLWNEIRPLLKPDAGSTALRRATGAYLHAKRYYFASAQPDSMRHDIDGKPLGPLSAEDRLVAQQRFLNLKRTAVEAGGAKTEPICAPAALSKAEKIRASLLGRTRQVEQTVS